MNKFNNNCIAINLNRMDFDVGKGRRLIADMGGFANCVVANIYSGPNSQSHHAYVISRDDKSDFENYAESSDLFERPIIVDFDEITQRSRLY